MNLHRSKTSNNLVSEFVNFYDVPDDNAKLFDWYVKKTIASELRSCWDKVGKGTYNLFSDWETNFEDCSKDSDSKKVIK